MVMEKVNREKEKAEHHLDLRRLAPPAFPHMKPPGVAQKKELGREECVGGGLGRLTGLLQFFKEFEDSVEFRFHFQSRYLNYEI